MSVAYRSNVAYDYRQEEPERREQQAAARARQRRHNAFALAVRRAVAMLAAVMIAAVCVGLLYVKAQVYRTQRDVNSLQTKIVEAERKNSTLNEQYNEAANIYVIMEKAEDLGMTYPDAKNVLYVDTSKSTSIKNNR